MGINITPMNHKTLVGVIGAGDCDRRTSEQAYAVGKGLAENGLGIVCGGLGGVMEAACRGASEAGGLVVGVLPGDSPDTANPYVGIKIATGMGIARNVIIVRSAKVVVAISGGPGTLSEIAHCLQIGVPVIALDSFDVSPDIIKVASPAEAVSRAVECATRTG